MKIKLLLLLTFAVGVCKAQFHIRVECFGHTEPQAYCIYFTSNNWKSKYPIKEAFDISDEISDEVVFQENIFQGDSALTNAIKYAKKFKTYNQCISYNDYGLKKYYLLLAYRKKHPLYKPKPIATKKECCKIHNIY